MTELVVVIGLIVTLVMASLASPGWDVLEMRNREVWWWTGILTTEAYLIENTYMSIVVALIVLGLFRIGRSWFILRSFLIPVTGLAGAYAVLTPLMQPWMIAPVLTAGMAVGCALGAWAALGLLVTERPFNYVAPNGWWGMWGVYEHCQTPMRHLCGQGNTMHLSGVSALGTSCAVGLGLMGRWWAWCVVPLCLLPILAVTRDQSSRIWFNQGTLTLGVMAWAVVMVYWPILGLGLLLMAVMAIVSAVLRAHPWRPGMGWYDSNRLAYWRDAIELCWWPCGWRKRLFGFGSHTWLVSTIRIVAPRQHPEILSSAHNEFIQQLLEHGLIGLVALLAYLGDALWRAWHGGPEGQALFVIECVWCAIAMVNFPAVWYHEYHPPSDTEQHWFGSPTLNAWTFVLAILAEAL